MALTGPEDVFAYDMPPEKVVAHAVASNVRAISYAFGEPVVFYEYMADTAELAGKAGLLNLLHTSGYIQPEPLKELTGKIDAANVDLKSFDPAFYRDVVGGRLEPVLESLRLIKKSGVHLEVTNMIIPSLNDDPGLIGGMCEWIKSNLGADVPLHFARFYPLYKLSSLPRTPVSTLDRAREIAVGKGLKFVYIAKVPGHDAENTFCPGCRKIVVKRVGFIVDGVNIEDGACEHCGRKIAGRWK